MGINFVKERRRHVGGGNLLYFEEFSTKNGWKLSQNQRQWKTISTAFDFFHELSAFGIHLEIPRAKCITTSNWRTQLQIPLDQKRCNTGQTDAALNISDTIEDLRSKSSAGSTLIGYYAKIHTKRTLYSVTDQQRPFRASYQDHTGMNRQNAVRIMARLMSLLFGRYFPDFPTQAVATTIHLCQPSAQRYFMVMLVGNSQSK